MHVGCLPIFIRVDVPLLDPDIVLRMFVSTLISVLGASFFATLWSLPVTGVKMKLEEAAKDTLMHSLSNLCMSFRC